MKKSALAFALTLAAAAATAAAAPLKVEPTDGMYKVAVVLSEGATVIDFAGPWEVFQDVMIDDGHGKHVMPFDLYTVAPTRATLHTSGSGHAGLTVTPDYTFADAPMPDIVVIGAQAGGDGLSEWLRKVHADNRMIMSVCTGAFKVAKAGLLDGKEATTHHWFFGNFSRDFPGVKLVRNVRYVEADPTTFSAGGLTSGVDLALHVVAERFGVEQAQKTADYMEYQGTGWKVSQVSAEFPTPVTRQDWSGEIAPHSILTVHLVTYGASPTASADLPARRVAGAPASLRVDGGMVTISFDAGGHKATFAGRPNADESAIVGTFDDDGVSRPLKLALQRAVD